MELSYFIFLIGIFLRGTLLEDGANPVMDRSDELQCPWTEFNLVPAAIQELMKIIQEERPGGEKKLICRKAL